MSDSLVVAVGAGDEIFCLLVPPPTPLPVPVVDAAAPGNVNVPLPSIARILSLTEEDVDLTPAAPVMEEEEAPRREDVPGERERLAVGPPRPRLLGVLVPGCEPVLVRGCAAGLGLDDFRPTFETEAEPEAEADAEVELAVLVEDVGTGDGEGDKFGRVERGVAERSGTLFFSSFPFSIFSDVEAGLALLREVRGLVSKRELVEEGREVREVRGFEGSAVGVGGLLWVVIGLVLEGLGFVLCEEVAVAGEGACAFPLSFLPSFSFSDSSGRSTSSKASPNISSASSMNPFATPISLSNASFISSALSFILSNHLCSRFALSFNNPSFLSVNAEISRLRDMISSDRVSISFSRLFQRKSHSITRFSRAARSARRQLSSSRRLAAVASRSRIASVSWSCLFWETA